MRIAEYGEENREDLIALADAVLGKEFFRNPSQVGRSSNSYVFVALDKDDALVGFIRGRLLAADGLRDFMENLRSTGVQTGGPPPINNQDRQQFANQLDRWLAKKNQPK